MSELGYFPLKYRPQSFDEVVGNESTMIGLQTTFNRDLDDVPRVFLFYGPRGTGKTTCARIIKKMLNIADVDFKEYNASNTRGIDTVRELEQKCRLSPMMGKMKMYLLDEVHRLTPEAMDAILKLLEDGAPKHTVFCLCTTEPDRLSAPLRSRCTLYKLETLPMKKIKHLLNRICEAEDITIPDEILQKICEVSEGSPRDAVKFLDTIIDIEDTKTALEMLENIKSSDANTFELCQEIMKGNQKRVWEILRDLKDVEPEHVRWGILGYLSKVALSKPNDKIIQMMELFSENYFYTKKSGLIISCYYACKL